MKSQNKKKKVVGKKRNLINCKNLIFIRKERFPLKTLTPQRSLPVAGIRVKQCISKKQKLRTN